MEKRFAEDGKVKPLQEKTQWNGEWMNDGKKQLVRILYKKYNSIYYLFQKKGWIFVVLACTEKIK